VIVSVNCCKYEVVPPIGGRIIGEAGGKALVVTLPDALSTAEI
jgi:hypothetical protein